MNLTADFFTLHGLEQRFALDTALLEARFKQLQMQTHPDKFVSAPDADKRAAMQASVRVNEAYQTLKNPLKRAAYLCELRGAAINEHRNTAMPAGFLAQQIEWREALHDAQSTSDLDELQTMVTVERTGALAKLALLLDTEQNYSEAALVVRSLMFIDKFADEVADAIELADQSA
jgi:molecular chaperone HscB